LPGVHLDRPAQDRLRRLVSGGTFTNSWHNYRVYPDKGFVRVLGCPGDVREVARLVQEFQERERNKLLVESGAEPGGPPNAGSAALHQHR
jgi:hypothetical protein